MRLQFTVLWVLASLALVPGCAGPARTGTRPDSKIGSDPLSHVEVVISGLSRSDAEAFRGQLLAQGDVQDVVLKSYANKVATYELDVRGCECDLPAKIDRIHSPRFRYEGRTTRITYSAFDNSPPVISFEHPEDGRVLNDPDPVVAVAVRDSDVDYVEINGVRAQLFRGDVYVAKIHLTPGSNTIIAKARDKAGLVTEHPPVKVTLNTLALNEGASVVVEGNAAAGSKVLVDGKDVPVDAKGRYRTEVRIQKGKNQIEIIAIGPDGRKTVTVKEVTLQ